MEITLEQMSDIIGGMAGRGPGGSMKPAMEAVGSVAVASVNENFQDQGRPTPWTPHAIATLTMRAAKVAGKKSSYRTREMNKAELSMRGSLAGIKSVMTNAARAKIKSILRGEGQILIVTGHLMNSVGFKASEQSVAIGTNIKYGAIQHFGGMAGRGDKVKIPARPYLMLQDSDAYLIGKILATWISEGQVSNGLN